MVVQPLIATSDAVSQGNAKEDFANSAAGFANRAANPAMLRIYGAAAVAAIIVATTAGAFGTAALPLIPRLLFWALLIGLNTTLWICWFAWRVRKPSDWWPASFVGALAINLPLPIEISALLQLIGGPGLGGWHITWLHAGAISAAILLVVTAVTAIWPRQPIAPPKGRLWRAGFRSQADLAAISAEDHYCRIWSPDGSSRLIHARFRDLTEEAATFDGAIVRRGHWVAANAVRSIRRDGRRWNVELVDGRAIPVASSLIPTLRDRGWLASGGAAAPPTLDAAQ
ncbi:MAG TPA: LytTR family transcriptional regulator DNA-binding domain-containing protein [Sphingomicrobium sp.]|nr:LytTR family transcriptional regulator DNA-binding domain-containing protein [Sphingomicrobium sp.]